MQLRHWYFAVNDNGIKHFDRCIRVAVASARANTSLIPICLYSGDGSHLIDKMEADGVRIIRLRGSLADAISKTDDANGWAKIIATGATLRLDIPLYEDREKFVLYTDCDVMFLRQPEMPDVEPQFFAAAPEHDPDNWTFANTGVMVMNVEALRHEHGSMVEFAAPRLNTFGPLGRGTYDQGILNAYFSDRWERLPLEMNWKPYWGLNPMASIIHFHGPKPRELHAIMAGHPEHVPPIYRGMYAKNPDAYQYFLKRFLDIETGPPPAKPLTRLRRLLRV